MSSLIPFSFESQSIRVVVLDGQPMFSARDVAVALCYANPSEAYKDHCKYLKLLSYSELLELNWDSPNPRGEYVMPESDVYRMIIKSNKPEAERFERWVFEEVLPPSAKPAATPCQPPSPPSSAART
jgi:Prophage antirepressor